MKLEDLFDHVDQSGGPDACWPWLEGRHARGYGMVWDDDTKKHRLAHPVALELHSGEPADGRKCLHSCDNPPCCNPSHLLWGTQADNIKDMDAKGRRVVVATKGEAHTNAKLTNSQAAAIRLLYVPRSKEFGQVPLAKKYGVSQRCISAVILGKTYI